MISSVNTIRLMWERHFSSLSIGLKRRIAERREDEGYLTTKYVSCFPAEIRVSNHQIEELSFADAYNIAVRTTGCSKTVGFPEECRWKPKYRSGREYSIEARRSGYLQTHSSSAYKEDPPVPAAGTEQECPAAEMRGYTGPPECLSQICRC